MAREAEADALCKENTMLKQQLRSLQQDCGRSRGAFHAVTAELAEVKDAFRQVCGAKAQAQVVALHASFLTARQMPRKRLGAGTWSVAQCLFC